MSSNPAVLTNKQSLVKLVGQRVRLIGKLAGATPDGAFLRVMASDGIEVRCRLNGQSRPSGNILVVQISGVVEQDAGTISADSPVIELGSEIDLQLLNEAINLQFAKPFQHLFVPGVVAPAF